MSNVTAVPIQPIKRSIVVWIVLGVIAAVAFGIWLAFAGTNPVIAAKGTNEQFLAYNARQSGVVTTASGLQYKELEKGNGGASPTDSDVTLVEYSGKLRDGREFDASQRPTPMPVAGVVPGFSEGLKKMKKGSKYRFWIKPELGYGERTPDPNRLPPNSVLVFDVKLLDFLPAAVVQQMQQQQQQQGMGGAGGLPPGMGGPPPGAAPGQ